VSLKHEEFEETEELQAMNHIISRHKSDITTGGNSDTRKLLV
jgi:hypothetical protein